jgi:hypothetical protein
MCTTTSASTTTQGMTSRAERLSMRAEVGMLLSTKVPWSWTDVVIGQMRDLGVGCPSMQECDSSRGSSSSPVILAATPFCNPIPSSRCNLTPTLCSILPLLAPKKLRKSQDSAVVYLSTVVNPPFYIHWVDVLLMLLPLILTFVQFCVRSALAGTFGRLKRSLPQPERQEIKKPPTPTIYLNPHLTLTIRPSDPSYHLS